jgi:hypothetical protein
MDILIPTKLVLKKTRNLFQDLFFFLVRRIIVYYSKKQSIVVLFFIKTKYYTLYKTIQEIVWLRQILTRIRYNIPNTKYILIIRSNQGFLLLIENPELYQASMHIAVKYYYIRDEYRHNHITLYYTPITKIITNSLTKPFIEINFRKFV